MKTDEGQTLSVRLSAESVTEIEVFRQKMAQELPGSEPSMADAVRVLLKRGLKGSGSKTSRSARDR